MKIFIGLFFAGLLMSVTGFAQDDYLDMKFGIGVPVGKFSDNGLETNGYAGPGFMMSFEGTYFLGRIGFTGGLTYGMNFLDDVTLQDDITAHLKELFPDVEISPDALVQFVTTPWSNVNALVGPVLSLPVSVIYLEMRAMGGMSFVMPPTWKMDIESGENKLHSMSSGQSVKLAYLVGAGIAYNSSGNYGLRLGVDYVGTKTSFGVNYVYEEGITEKPYQEKSVEIPVNMFQTTLGITYTF